MNREDANHLLMNLKEHAKKNVIIDTFLRQAIVEVKCDFLPDTPSDEYVDNVIIDKHLLKLAETIIIFQSKIVSEWQDDLSE